MSEYKELASYIMQVAMYNYTLGLQVTKKTTKNLKQVQIQEKC